MGWRMYPMTFEAVEEEMVMMGLPRRTFSPERW